MEGHMSQQLSVLLPFTTPACFLSTAVAAGLSPGESSASASIVSSLLSTTLKKLPHLEEPDGLGAAMAHPSTAARSVFLLPDLHTLAWCEVFLSLHMPVASPYSTEYLVSGMSLCPWCNVRRSRVAIWELLILLRTLRLCHAICAVFTSKTSCKLEIEVEAVIFSKRE